MPAITASNTCAVQMSYLDKQIAEANARLAQQAANPQGGPNFVQNTIVGPLVDKRVAAINRIATAIGRVNGDCPADLVNLASPCAVR
ncbi:hypothetical protein Vqi01_18060 [Micromonospora qiuiae]|uniref:Uncharacterized protein n=1 Tax=Micromonospora qiuiae TaxID=502268 RepID=A0ABQ4J8Z4_9ACTN|nr:hypothetical protein [Micromonospora qiuiae]GIJ26644.1 hypothetical protein Vqi01_18060 [Micromonospora qiuiae]